MDEVYFIPEKVKIGYIDYKGSDTTLSGHLGILTYTKEDGSVANNGDFKKYHFNKTEEISNIPIEGLRINKKTLGRSEYTWSNDDLIRLQDPRGFDFDITSTNFIELLKECDCIGGVLCGQFIFSWITRYGKTQLILLSTSGEDYKRSAEVMKVRLGRNYKATDLIPGCIYKLKIGKLRNTFGNPLDTENRGTGVFIGIVKLPKAMKKAYESACLFYCHHENLDREFVYVINPQDIDYEVKRDYLGSTEVNRILGKFKKTAYSWDFWNRTDKFIDFLEYVGDLDSSRFSLLFTDIGFSRNLEKVAVMCGDREFYYMKKFIQYIDKSSKPPFCYRKQYYLYPAYRLSVVSGKMEIIEKIADLYKTGKTIRPIYSSCNFPVSAEEIYKGVIPDEEIKKAVSSSQVPVKGQSGLVVYRTDDGEYSESLQIMLSKYSNSSFDKFIKDMKQGQYYDSFRLYLPSRL